ncbi:hypothetical protein BKA66DRAFT_443167 [Pyrenochaeta sp. MPI-SDFR-AT-0127]|nr:hypothetical protein BKA66DRAFT_443167 [Pyrenochaeta sp. MPI-SDFR-AT-0127]
MADYSFKFLIDNAVLALQTSDKLCIAKKVCNEFTTIFSAASMNPERGENPLYNKNTIVWTEKFRVFATDQFQHGLLVSSSTKEVEINFGDASTWSDNQFGPASPAPITDFIDTDSYNQSFLLRNVPQGLQAGVTMQVNGKWCPIFVDPNRHARTSNKQLTPMNEYVLFWDSQLTANVMIDQSELADQFHFTFDGGAKTKTICFGYAIPEKQGRNESPKFYHV